ncbi:type II secretion system protein GspH [Rheinheimera riviphila]|uniref:Type II secretion system protein H n=1 Tax=Rheinheimera riviphila TaxID=1834037 RepID=A0A437QZD0_9GAMM|nr:type II secretion system minor pseudopilin GspH [Rheinheimera riviphila]RVU39886.1 type II secretion system protein GspH [Rheinheimera riviphila]
MKHQRLNAGFTLIEVLLVILLIGLLASAVVINFSGESRDKQLVTQTGQLQQLIHIASETAMLKQQELGLFVDNEGYRFMLFQDDKWHSISEPKSLRPRQFPPGYKIELELEGLEWSEGNLLSQLEWQEEEETLFEENSFDQREAEKLKQATEEGNTAAPKLRTGFEIAPRQKDDPKLPQVYLLSSGEVTPFLLTVRDDTESPVWSQQLKAVFSIPLERTEVSRER